MAAEMERTEKPEAGRLGDLYVRYSPDAIRLAYILTGDRDLAEDLVQDAFVKVARRLGHLRHPDAFGAYLRRTVVNLSHNHFRRRRVEHAVLDRLAHAPSSSPNPNEELDDAIHAAILRLPARQREAMVLHFYEDLSDVQTAELLRCRPGTVRSLISRGMTSLRKDLEGVDR